MAGEAPYWDIEQVFGTVHVAAVRIEQLTPPEHRSKMNQSIDMMKMHHHLQQDAQLLCDINDILMLSLDTASSGCLYEGIDGTVDWLSKLQTQQAMLTYAMQHLIQDR